MAVCGRRVCAVLAVISAVLHLAMLGHAGSVLLAAAIAAMALTCLFCGFELWRGGSVRTWCVVAVMSLAMVGVHWSVPSHSHGAVDLPVEPMSALMVVATTVSVIEAVTATAVLWVLTRRRGAEPV
ncbi:hypothetical protein ACWDUN_09155 [Mycobacterium sp. NPDC003323]